MYAIQPHQLLALCCDLGYNSSTEKATYSYDDTDGRVTKINYGCGAYATYGYDACGAVTSIKHYDNYNGGLIAGLGYEYDKAGNVTKLTWSDNLDTNRGVASGRAAIAYLYDDLHRLRNSGTGTNGTKLRRNMNRVNAVEG